jgi:hypothetical protein
MPPEEASGRTEGNLKFSYFHAYGNFEFLVFSSVFTGIFSFADNGYH